jgi:hypothetical protein
LRAERRAEYYIPTIDPALRRPIIATLSFLGSSADRVSLKSKAVKRVIVTVCVLATLWVTCCIALYSVMRQSPEQFGRVMAKISGPIPFLVFPFETLWMRARAGTLQVGSPAPDFALTKLDKTATIQLSSLTAQNRPVVLVFGSYT